MRRVIVMYIAFIHSLRVVELPDCRHQLPAMISRRILLCLVVTIFYLSCGSASTPLTVKSLRATPIAKTSTALKSFKAGSFRGGEIPFHDLSVSAVVMGLSSVWLKAWTTLAKAGILESTLTRKIIHCGSAPLFIAQWPLYSSSPCARYYAALIPLFQLGRWAFILLFLSFALPHYFLYLVWLQAVLSRN